MLLIFILVSFYFPTFALVKIFLIPTIYYSQDSKTFMSIFLIVDLIDNIY